MPFHLSDFLGELSEQQFYDEIWDGGFHVVHGELARVAPLAALPLFASEESMLQAHRGLVPIFQPGGGRAEVQKRMVDELLGEGCTAYLNLTSAGALDVYREQIAFSLLCHPDDVICEGFISRRGSLSSAHFDPEHNFHYILSGRKRWRLAKNTSVQRPLTNWVVGHRLFEEGSEVRRYKDGPMPKAFPDEGSTTVEVTAGDTLYFGPGVWHEVYCEEDALSVNFAVRPDSWAKAIAYAVEQSLQLDPEMRRLIFGRGAKDEELEAHFERVLRARVHDAVDRVRAKSLMERVVDDD